MSYVPVPDFAVPVAAYVPIPNFIIDDSANAGSSFVHASFSVNAAAVVSENKSVSAVSKTRYQHNNSKAVFARAMSKKIREFDISYGGISRNQALFSIDHRTIDDLQKRIAITVGDKVSADRTALISAAPLVRQQCNLRAVWNKLASLTTLKRIDAQPLQTTRKCILVVVGMNELLKLDMDIPWGEGPSNTGNNRIVKFIPYPEIELPNLPTITPTLFLLMDTFRAYTANGDDILIENCSITLDNSSWAWALSATVLGDASLNLIKPASSGVVDINIEVNGYLFVFIVESYAQNRTFGKNAYTITGRSRTAYLAAPFATEADYYQDAQYSAQQLIDNHLDLTGFVANFNINDWLMDAGVFSYTQKSPIQAIGIVAAAAGAIITPDRALDEININHKYANNAWDWASLTGLPAITEDMIVSLGMQYQPGTQFNGVYVSGSATGVNVFVRRTGTPGDVLAQSVVDDLIVDVTPGTDRGKSKLSASGNKASYQIEMPVFAPTLTPRLYNVGDMLNVSESSNTWNGLVTGITINAQNVNRALVVTQSLTIERHLS